MLLRAKTATAVTLTVTECTSQLDWTTRVLAVKSHTKKIRQDLLSSSLDSVGRNAAVALITTEAIFTNSSRTMFAKCSQTYSYLLGRVGGGGGGRRASLLLPPPPLTCHTLYRTSVQFTNFVRELLVNIASGYPFPSPFHGVVDFILWRFSFW
jgi:hypothetical protein